MQTDPAPAPSVVPSRPTPLSGAGAGGSTEPRPAGRLPAVPSGPVRTRWQLAVVVAAAIAGAAALGCALTGDRVSDRLHEDEPDCVTAAVQLRQHGVLAFSAPAAAVPPTPDSS